MTSPFNINSTRYVIDSNLIDKNKKNDPDLNTRNNIPDIPMCSGKISQVQFEKLFTENVTQENIDTLDLLMQFSSQGDEECMDILINIALRQDNIGCEASNRLYDLFSGASISSEYEDIPAIISKKCFDLQNLAENTKDKYMEKITQPSKLYFMSANALDDATKKSDCAKVLSDHFKKEPLGSDIFDDMLSLQRMTDSDDLYAGLNAKLSGNEHVNINYPVAIEQLKGQIVDKFKANRAMDKLDMFTFNVSGNHWLLAVAYLNKEDNEHHFVVFSSLNNEQSHIEKIVDVANEVKVNKENVHFIDGQMQIINRNECGLFVLKGAELIAENPLEDPKDVLEQFVQDFRGLTPLQKSSFNVNQRRQLMGYLFDDTDRRDKRYLIVEGKL